MNESVIARDTGALILVDVILAAFLGSHVILDKDVNHSHILALPIIMHK